MAIDLLNTCVNRSGYKVRLSIPFRFITPSINWQPSREHCVNPYAMMDAVSVFSKKTRESAN